MCSTCFLACGRHLLKGVLCGWEDSAPLNFSRWSIFCLIIFNYKSVFWSLNVFNFTVGCIHQILGNQLEPLTDQQLMGICNLQQSSQQTEDALSQGMEALQQSLVDTLSSTTHGSTGSADVADYMGQMAIAMGKLATLQDFLIQVTILINHSLCAYHLCIMNHLLVVWVMCIPFFYLLGWPIEAANSATIASYSDHSTSCSRPSCYQRLLLTSPST